MSKTKFTKLNLERLEARVVPAVLVWKGGDVNNPNDWDTAANWFNRTTNAAAGAKTHGLGRGCFRQHRDHWLPVRLRPEGVH